MRFLLTPLLILLLGTGVRAQFTVSGTVTDAKTGEPLIGASVLVKGTTTGQPTDMDGHFSFIAPGTVSEPCTLQVIYVGYVTEEIVVGQQKEGLTITLSAGIVLDEVKVTGYRVPLIETDKTTSGQVISSEQMSKISSKKSRRGKRRKQQQQKPDPVRPTAYNNITPNAFIATAEQPISTLSTDVDRAAYANVRSYLNRGQLPPADAVRIEEMINYFPYQRPAYPSADPVQLNAEIITCPWRAEAKLLRVTAETPPATDAVRGYNNLVFLIDVSGSMGQENKLPLLKQSLRMLSRELTATDRVSIVVYAGAAGRVLPPTPGNDTTTIFGVLDYLEAGGSTAGGAGIELAYKTAAELFMEQGNNRVIIATDGDFNVGMRSQYDLVKLIEEKRKSGVFLTVLGFGTGNYQEGTMQELADRGNGNHAYIDSPAEARKVLVEEFGGTIRTVAKDVKLQLVFKPEYIESYRLIGYENRLLNTEDFDDDTKDAAEMGAGHQVTVLYEIVPTKEYAAGDYLGSLKLRYKPAGKVRSRKLQVSIAADRLPDELATTDVRWAAAVAEFGMLLRGSEHKGDANYDDLLRRAEASLGADPGGYRRNMVGLIRRAQGLTGKR